MNKDKLLAIIKEYGETQGDLAETIGLSRTRLSAKIHSKQNAVFTQPEIAEIKRHYHLSNNQVNEIFFT